MAQDLAPDAVVQRKGNSNTLLFTLGAFVAVMLIAGGWFLHNSGEPAAAQGDNGDIRSVVHLESFVVNLSGNTENGYLRVGIDLGVEAQVKDTGKQSPFMGRLRDTILSVLATRTVEELLTAPGKAKLKDDLLKAINDRVPELRCREVYFTEFLVQH